MQEFKEALKAASKNLFDVVIEPELERPAEQFGDYSTNAALQLAAKLNKNPHEVAEAIAKSLEQDSQFEKAEVAGPGFINFTLSDQALGEAVAKATEPTKSLEGQEILVEFGDPNPFKEMHIGHLYSYIVGDSIARLLENSGATVRRLSYHGDVGLHVAKALYGMKHLSIGREGRPLGAIPEEHRQAFMDLGSAYKEGENLYNQNESNKEEVEEINHHIYDKDDPEINKLYETGKQWSFEYFDKILDLLGIKNDKRYLESEAAETGVEFVRSNVGKVFKESQGAIVYDGEKVGLHTRVFLTSKGLPTYESKDLGLAELKKKDYPDAARSIIITANEQSEYFKVMLAALAEIDADLAKKTTHLSHGFLSLSTGKMSSRTGNVYPAMKLLLEVKAAVHEQYPDSPVRKEVTFAAVKQAFLKHRLGSDIAVNIEESISLEGNSGPYLQYAHARACSILQKAGQASDAVATDFEPAERSLARKISEYPEVIQKATSELMPHHIANYLYELAQNFNSFYEANRVIGDSREATRLGLVKVYADVLKNGLSLLNISAPERM